MTDAETRVVALAEQIINRSVGLIEGARRLYGLRHSVTQDDRDPDFHLFMVIDSDTDDLPIGDARKHWAPEALQAKDAELKDIEDFYRKNVEEVCIRLVKRFKKET